VQNSLKERFSASKVKVTSNGGNQSLWHRRRITSSADDISGTHSFEMVTGVNRQRPVLFNFLFNAGNFQRFIAKKIKIRGDACVVGFRLS
jgi:hypothetical protein